MILLKNIEMVLIRSNECFKEILSRVLLFYDISLSDTCTKDKIVSK